MNKAFINQREMHRTFLDFHTNHQSTLDAIPVIKEIFVIQVANIANFEQLWEIINKKTTGSTLTKHNIKKDAAEHLNQVNLLFYNYCLKTNQLTDIAKLKGSVSSYTHMADEQFITRLEYSCQFGDDLGEQLAETAVTAEELTDLKTLCASYIAASPRPKEIQSSVKIANKKIKKVAADILNTNKTRLDAVMESFFANANLDLYQAYLEASHVEKTYSRKTAVSGSIFDKESKLPVPQAHILIEEAGIDHLCQGEKGGFRIKNLEPGTYHIEIQAVTYKTISMELVHRYGETNVLDLEMESE